MSVSKENVSNVDPGQIQRFAAYPDWWNRQGSYRALHAMNPARMRFIEEAAREDCGHDSLAGLRVLDMGCGGGILSLALAAAGARLTAIDAQTDAIEAGRRQAARVGVDIDFRIENAGAHQNLDGYDIVACCELLEHVPDFTLLVADCARLVRPGGLVIFSTLTRTPLSFLGAIVGAEYLFNIVPRGTHRYIDFIRPGELDRCARRNDLWLSRINGISYSPYLHEARLSRHIRINYIAACVRRCAGQALSTRR